MNKNFKLKLIVLFVLIFFFVIIPCLNSFSQPVENPSQGREIWPGDAHVSGTFGADSLSATGTISATGAIYSASGFNGENGIFDRVILGASSVIVEVTNSLQNGQSLIFSSEKNRFYPSNVGSTISIDDIVDVSATSKSNQWVIAWNAASNIWEATPQITTGGSSISAIGDINNVSDLAKQTNDLLQWNGTYYEALRIATIMNSIDLIGDVDTTGKSHGDLLGWSATENIWKATSSGGGGGASDLASLSDTDIISPASGEYLQHNGTAWINNQFSQALENLSNVIGTPNDNDVLTFDSGGSVWQPEAGGGGSSGASRTATITIASVSSANSSEYDLQATGENDQNTLIQAFDTLSSTGGKIILGEGAFYFGSIASVTYDNISIEGQGLSSKLYREFNSTSDEGILSINADNIEISHLYFNGNASEFTSVDNSSLSLSFSDNVFISNCAFTNNSKAGIFTSVSNLTSTDIIIENCISYNNDIGFELTDIINLTISKCIARNNSDQGFYFSDIESSNISSSMALSNGSAGFEFISISTACNVSNCYSIDNGSYGYEFGSSVRANITGSYALNSVRGFSIDDDSQLSGCYAYNNSVYGLAVGNSSHEVSITNSYFRLNSTGIEVIFSNDNILIEGCFIYNNSSYGIEIHDGNRISLQDSLIFDNGNHGILIDDINDMFISDCFIYNNLGTIQSTQVRIIGNGNRLWMNGCYFKGTDALEPLIAIHNSLGSTTNNVFNNNKFTGDYSEAIYIAGTEEPIQFGNIFDDSSGPSNAMILASSSTAKIGIATNTTDISNVIYVDQRATTNPIATSWDTHSLPELKENIESIDETKKDQLLNRIDALNFIEFDWKAEQIDSSSIEEKSLIEEVNRVRREKFYTNPMKTDQLSLDIESENFPDKFASYNNKGEKVGINTSQVLMHTLIGLQEARAEIKELKSKITDLESRKN